MENHRPGLFNQVTEAFKFIRKAPNFISENKLWKGYLKTGWMAKVTIIVAFIFSIKLFQEFGGLLLHKSPEEGAEIASMGLMPGISELGTKLAFTGGMKYLMLIVLEMLIFYFSVRTYERLSGELTDLDIKDFIKAQVRMIKLAAMSWIYELILSILIGIGFSMFNLDFMTKVFGFLIQCFFIGAAFLDNYNEQFGLKVKESFKLSMQHLGAALTIGLIAYLLFLIPVLGAILAPFICAVGATCYMWTNEGKMGENIV